MSKRTSDCSLTRPDAEFLVETEFRRDLELRRGVK